MNFLENDIVKLKHKIDSFEIGSQGTILMCFITPDVAYLVEFSDEDGHTIDTPILKEDDIELIWRDGKWYQ